MASDCNLVVKEQQAFKFLKKKVFNFWYPSCKRGRLLLLLCVCVVGGCVWDKRKGWEPLNNWGSRPGELARRLQPRNWHAAVIDLFPFANFLSYKSNS